MSDNLQTLIDIKGQKISTVLQESLPLDIIENYKLLHSPNTRDRVYNLSLTVYGMLYQASQQDKSEQNTVVHLSEYYNKFREDYNSKKNELAPLPATQTARDRGRPKKLLKRPPKSKLKPISFNASSYNKAKERVDLNLLKSLFISKVEMLSTLSNARTWHGHKVFLADGSTLKTPDTKELREYFDVSGSTNPPPLPLARIECIVDLYSGGIADLAIGKYGESESRLIFPMYGKSISSGSILLADDLYCTFAHFAIAKSKGVDIIAQGKKSRNEKTLREISKNDSIVEWKNTGEPAWLDGDVILPTKIELRKITLTNPEKPNEVMYIYTSLMDSEKYPAQEISALFFSRWQIELSFKNIKILMDLEYLRSMTVEGVKKEIYAHILLYNILRIYLLLSKEINEFDSFFPSDNQIPIRLTASESKSAYVDVRGRSYNRKGGNRTHKSPC
jgi:hypothetical protein